MKDHGSLYRKCVVYIFPALALMLALYAKETSEAARDAIYLCLDVVIPSLFPFFVLSRLTVPFLKSFSCPRHLRRLIQGLTGLPCYVLPAIVLGYLSGYPTGAKLARDMLDEGFLDSSQASRVIAIANNCSPLFIIGTVGAGLFRSIRIGFILLAVHWVSGLLAALALNLLLKKRRSQANAGTVVFQGSRIENKNNRGIAALIPGAIEDAAVLSLKVSGYIVLFAVLSELMHKTGFFSLVANALSAILPGSLAGNTISALLRGIMEIASGSSAIALTVNSPVIVQLSLDSFICGFAGFSSTYPGHGDNEGNQKPVWGILLGKALHGIIACILTIAVLKLLPVSLAASGFRPAITGIPPDFRIFTIMTLIMALLASPYENGGRIRHPDKS